MNSDSDSGQETPPIVQHKPRGSRVELFIMGVDDMETEEVTHTHMHLLLQCYTMHAIISSGGVTTAVSI